jgi:hypothetical protein
MREQAEEEAFSKVEEATLESKFQRTRTRSRHNLRRLLAADWMKRQTRARYMSYVGTGKRPTIDATAQDVPPTHGRVRLCQSFSQETTERRTA